MEESEVRWSLPPLISATFTLGVGALDTCGHVTRAANKQTNRNMQSTTTVKITAKNKQTIVKQS